MIFAVRDQAIRLDPAPLKSDLAAHMTLLSEVLDRIDDFDVIHFHTDMIHFPMFERYAPRTVTTLHGRLDLKDLAPVSGEFSTCCASLNSFSRTLSHTALTADPTVAAVNEPPSTGA